MLRWLLILLSPCMVSCDKLKEAAAKVEAKVAGDAKIGGRDAGQSSSGPPGGDVDPAFAAQVDINDDGVLLRKDLPYPVRVTVRQVTQASASNLRLVRRSALGTESTTVNGTIESASLWERTGETLRLAIEKHGFVPDPPEAQKKDTAPAVASPDAVPESRAGLSGSFQYKGTSWKPVGKKGDFKRSLWLQEIEKSIDEIAINSGVLPRTHWFGKKRFKEGDSFTLSGDGLNVLFPGAEKGALQVVYEGRDAIAGHPCGRFSVKGDFSGREIAPDGTKSSGDLTITSGKVWLSLIHPVVLRKELDQVVSFTIETGGVTTRMQGAMTAVTSCEWKPGE